MHRVKRKIQHVVAIGEDLFWKQKAKRVQRKNIFITQRIEHIIVLIDIKIIEQDSISIAEIYMQIWLNALYIKYYITYYLT